MQIHELRLDNEDDLKTFVTERWKNRKYYKGRREQLWLEVISCYEGFTYNKWNDLQRRLVDDFDVPAWRVKLTLNLMLPYVRTGAAKFLRSRPIWDVLPAIPGEQDSVAQSLAGKRYLQAYWYKNNINYKFIDLLLWIGLTGNGYIYVYWDPDKGPLVQITPKDFLDQEVLQKIKDLNEFKAYIQQAQAQFEQFVQQNMGSDKLAMGDACINVVSPFDLVHPMGESFDDVEWIVHGKLNSETFYKAKGVDPTTLQHTDKSDEDNGFYYRRVNHLFGNTYDIDDCDKKILDLTCWIKRQNLPGLKEGLVINIAGGKVLHVGPNPFKHGLLPYAHFYAEKSPGNIQGFSAAGQILPLTREIQKSHNQILEARNLMSKPKWTAPRMAKLNKSAIDNLPGEVIEYSGIYGPKMEQPPNLPRYLFDELVMLQKSCDDIMAQRDATKGINPPGSRSATMLGNLQEQDDGALALTGLCFDNGFSIVGRLVLSTGAQFIREDRLMAYIGERNRYEVHKLKAGSLEPKNGIIGADYFDVRTSQFSQFGLSRAGQLEFLKTFLQYNIFTPNDRNKILKFVNLGNFSDEIDETRLDRNNAYEENQMMAQGYPIEINLEDNHTAHYEEHLDFMKTNEYKILPPEVKLIFQQHLQMTKTYVVVAQIEPQILAIKAQIIAANLNGIPLNLLGAGQNNEQKQ